MTHTRGHISLLAPYRCWLESQTILFFKQGFCGAQAYLKLLGLSDPPASASWVAWPTDAHPCAQLRAF